MLDTTFEDAVEHLTDIYVFWETSADTKLLKKQTLEIMADRVIDIISNYGDQLGTPESSSEDEYGLTLWLYQASKLCKEHIQMLGEQSILLIEEAFWSKAMEGHELVKLVKADALEKESITKIIEDYLSGSETVNVIYNTHS